MDNIIPAKQVRAQFADILNQVVYAGREFIISRFDKPVAKIAPIRDLSDNQEIKRRKKIVEKIMKLRKQFKAIYGNTDLTKIVIRERDKEYKRWTR